MKRRRRGVPGPLLTPVELEVMTALWRGGPAPVREVKERIPRPLAYTSVSTVLRILEQKGAVGSRKDKEGRGHVYFARLARERFQRATVRHVLDRVFEGASLALVRRLLEEERLGRKELDAIRALLDQRRRR